jgi:hypothetical protein
MTSTPDPASPVADPAPAPAAGSGEAHPHDFEVQKRLHRQIRNDPDYDDWEYGTEPLPNEAWVPAGVAPSVVASPSDIAGSVTGSGSNG